MKLDEKFLKIVKSTLARIEMQGIVSAVYFIQLARILKNRFNKARKTSFSRQNAKSIVAWTLLFNVCLFAKRCSLLKVF